MRSDDTDRTSRLAGARGSWILPFWMERQLDPSSPAWEPPAGTGSLGNVAARDVAPVGTIGAPAVAVVDPRGLITPWTGGWSLDWWVGADDRWHVPSQEVAVRQSLLEGSPVVDTAMRVPGGDVVERVWAFSDPVVGPVLGVELRNDGRVPVAVALSVRPYGIDGAVRVDEVVVDGSGIVVDGRRALWLAKPAARVAASTWADGDVAEVVLGGAAADADSVRASCADGMAQAAAVLPLSHGTSVVVTLPLDPDVVSPTARAPEVVPPADAVARGWASHRSRSARVVLPDGELTEAFDAATSQVMLAAAGTRLDTSGCCDAAAVVVALGRLGLVDEADPVIAGLPDGQRQGGQLGGDDPDDAATGAVLLAAGAHWALGRDDRLVAALAGQLAAGAHHRPGAGRLVRRVAPLGHRAAAWQLAGSTRAAAALVAAGQADAAAAIVAASDDLQRFVESSASLLDPVDVVELVWLGVLEPGSARTDASLARLRGARIHEGAVVGHLSGLSPMLTARLGSVELARGEQTALDRLRWLLDVSGPERAWPGAVHPRTGGGCGGEAWSAPAAAAFVELVADLLCVADTARRELRFLPVVPEGWLGAGIEAHGLHTPLGVVSFAVRWHGERPAILWEVEPHDDAPIRLAVPGLDRSWSSTEVTGEALLAAPTADPATIDDSPDGGPVPDGGASDDARDGSAPGPSFS